MKLPTKFTDHPWRTMAVFVVLGLLTLGGIMLALDWAANIFGPEWVAERVEQVLDEDLVEGVSK